MKQELTDIHQHPIWGMDDGADSRETMFSMLREAHFQGIKTIVATTHAAPGFHPFNMELYTERLAEAQAFCNLEDLQIRLLPGAEIAWTLSGAHGTPTGKDPYNRQNRLCIVRVLERYFLAGSNGCGKSIDSRRLPPDTGASGKVPDIFAVTEKSASVST